MATPANRERDTPGDSQKIDGQREDNKKGEKGRQMRL